MRYILIRMKTERAPRRAQARAPSDAAPAPARPPRRLSSDELLQGARQVVIEHAGREYRVQLTANGKLIMTA